MGPTYYLRNTDIRKALAPEHVLAKLEGEPLVETAHESGGNFIIFSGEAGIIDETTEPRGVVFKDRSFLAIYEKWCKDRDQLLAYSYHYQRSDLFVRYDMDENERSTVPRFHVHTTGLGGVHGPCGGRVSVEQVLGMITLQIL